MINNGNRGKEKVCRRRKEEWFCRLFALRAAGGTVWTHGSDSRVRQLRGLVYQSALLRVNKPEVRGQQQKKGALDVDATTF